MGRRSTSDGKVSIDSVLGEEAYQFPTLAGSVYHPPETIDKVLLVGVTLETLAITVLTLLDVSTMSTAHDRAPIAYSVVLIINLLFNIFYVWHGILRDQRLEIFGFMFATLLLTGYEIYDYIEHPRYKMTNEIRLIKLIRIIVVGAFVPFNIIIGYFVSTCRTRLSYMISGASEVLQGLYQRYDTFTCFLRFDLQAAATFILLSGFSEQESTDELLFLCFGGAISIVWAIMGYLMVRREWKLFVPVFFILWLCVPAFAGYKIYYLSTSWDSYKKDGLLSYPLIACLGVALACRLFVGYCALRCVLNFGKGLKENFKVSEGGRGNESTPLITNKT